LNSFAEKLLAYEAQNVNYVSGKKRQFMLYELSRCKKKEAK